MDNEKLSDLYVEQHQDKDCMTLPEMHKKYKYRQPKSDCPREKKLVKNFNHLQTVIGGSASLQIYYGNCSSFSCLQEVGINLEMHDDFQSTATKVSIEQVDLYVLAHEFGHQAQITHQFTRYRTSTKRSKEANADYFAGVWI